MSEYRLNIPLNEKTVGKLRVGDVVYLSGVIHTARDKAHQRMLETKETPFKLKGGVLFHCGPLVKRYGRGYLILGAGPTTSSRMNSMTPEVLDRFPVKAIIGKGGMNKDVAESLMKNKAVYLAMTGGCAVSAADKVEGINGIFWEDLGLAEAVWGLEVKDFGPLIVGIDSHSNSLYERARSEVQVNLKRILSEL